MEKQRFRQKRLPALLALSAAIAAAAFFLRFGFAGRPSGKGIGVTFVVIVGGASWAIQQLAKPAAVRDGRRVSVYEGFASDPTPFDLDDIAGVEVDPVARSLLLVRRSGERLLVSTARFTGPSLAELLSQLPRT